MSFPTLQSDGTNKRVNSGLDQTFVAVDVIPVTPSDTTDLPRHARAIRARTGGDLRITTFRGEVRDTFISDGELLPVYAQRIHATGTSATGLEALI